MFDAILLSYSNIVLLGMQRSIAGPPMAEHEVLLYMQACRLLQEHAWVAANHWENERTKRQPKEDEG